jgi:hypothetical protein
MIDYKLEYVTMATAQQNLDSRIGQMIAILTISHSKVSGAKAISDTLPLSWDLDWDMDIERTNQGVFVNFTKKRGRFKALSAHFTWEELQYSRDEVLSMWSERGKAIVASRKLLKGFVL